LLPSTRPNAINTFRHGEELMASRFRTTLVFLAVGCAALGGCSASTSGGSSAQRGAPNAAPAQPGWPSPAPYGSAGYGPDGFATEVDPASQPQSTFAMDVDTASYGYARNLIQQGRRPSPQDVRPEEFVNAFRQDYPQPSGDGFSVTVDGMRLPEAHHARSGGDVRLLRIGLQTRGEDREQRRDAALTFVIDVSGSMGDPGKLDMVKQALHTLVDQLRPSDSVAIVTFSDNARVVRPMTRIAERSDLHAAIDELRIEGSTNLEAGLVKGYQVAREGFRTGLTNRVILLSDGLANTGDTEAAPILAQVREEAEKQITLLGVGVGSDYGDQLMEQLADRGDGYVVYVSELAQARKVFVEQLPATLSVRALDAKVQVTFDAATVAGYRLIGYDDRKLAASAFRNDRVDGGEVGPGHSVTALYTVRLRGSSTSRVALAQVRWQDPATREPRETMATVTVTNLGGSFADASPRLQVCYAAAYFAEALRHSPYGSEVRLIDLSRMASSAAGRTGDADVADLADLIRRAGE
jgi:Ca-activated chloride channel family protein